MKIKAKQLGNKVILLSDIKCLKNKNGHVFSIYSDIGKEPSKRFPGLNVENIQDFLREHFLLKENENKTMRITIEILNEIIKNEK